MVQITHTFEAHHGFSYFLEFFANFQGWLHSLPMLNQILIFIGLVALTVGISVVIYYIIKGAFKLTFEVIKAAVHILKGFFDALFNHARAPRHPQYRRQALPTSSPYLRKTTRTMPVHSVSAPVSPTSASATSIPQTAIHCPDCGELFTPEMVQVMQEQKHVFCEFCGKNLELVLS